MREHLVIKDRIQFAGFRVHGIVIKVFSLNQHGHPIRVELSDNVLKLHVKF